MIVGLGGAPAVVAMSSRGNGPASGAFTIEMSTVGAALRCDTPSSRMRRQISTGSTLRRQTCLPPIPVIAQVVHQPLQWNIGRVHR